MISLEEFHGDFIQSILFDSESRGLLKHQSFFEKVCEELTSTGDLSRNYTFAVYKKKGLEVDGFDYDEERRVLSLLVHHYFQDEIMQTLSRNQIDVKFSRLKTYFQKCSLGLYKDLEETSEAYSMSYNIYNYLLNKKIDKIRLMVLSDGKATRNLREIPTETIDGIEYEYRVIDLDYIFSIFISENTSGEFEIDVDLPCLEIDSASENYKSYLSVVSGELIVDIYEKYGKKLLEQNIRTFLQFRGDVNKGLRNTIEYQPEMFFAYNNGITATASNIEFAANGNITKICNFQIVNGGQTTSAIYASSKKSTIDLSKISVQMKLSVVKDTSKLSDFVSSVAEYANTQNKVSKSDFFSNNPFHKEFKNYSQLVRIPAVGGAQKRTRWFYERVRGEYLNEQAYLSKSEKKQFQLENPKHQLVDKTFLSKSENVWLKKPDIVSKGAQYSFKEFATYITEKLENDKLAITEKYYKDAISRIILFRSVEKLVSNAEWYDGGFRAQTVAYTISYLSYVISESGMHFNFNPIWEAQKLPDSLAETLEIISEKVYQEITHPPQGFANIAQWTKRKDCWQNIKKMGLRISVDQSLLHDREEQTYKIREDRKSKKVLKGCETQIFVVKVSRDSWKKLLKYYQENESTSPIRQVQYDILKKMSNGELMPPSEKQSEMLYQVYEKAKNEGVTL